MQVRVQLWAWKWDFTYERKIFGGTLQFWTISISLAAFLFCSDPTSERTHITDQSLVQGIYNISGRIKGCVLIQSVVYFVSRVNIGLFCSTPGVALARAVPRKVALEMLFTGNPISAEGEQHVRVS